MRLKVYINELTLTPEKISFAKETDIYKSYSYKLKKLWEKGELFKSWKDQGHVVYHGTQKQNINNILKSGFKSGTVKGVLGERSISFSISPKTAERFGDSIIKWYLPKQLEKHFLKEKDFSAFYDWSDNKGIEPTKTWTKENLKEYGNYVGVLQMEKNELEFRVYDVSIIDKDLIFSELPRMM